MTKTKNRYGLFKVVLVTTILSGLVYLSIKSKAPEEASRMSESNLSLKARNFLGTKEKPGSRISGQMFEHELDEQGELIKAQYKKALEDYDKIEEQYTEANRIYTRLFEKFADDPHNPTLVDAFRDSDEILQRLLEKSNQISELYKEIVNRYSEELAKR